MKFWIKRNIDLIIINLLTLVIGLFLYFLLTEDKVQVLGAILATGISISVGIRQYNIENDKMFKELFYEFNQKYDSKFNNILNEIDSKCKQGEKFELVEEVPLIIDYLNFCSEEYLWYEKGRISTTVWASWEIGMLYFINLEPINKVIQDQRAQKASYYGLFDKIGSKIINWN